MDFAAELERARRDSDALGALLRRVSPRVQRAVRADLPARWRHVLSVDDVLQQSFVDVFQQIERFAGDSFATFERWVLRIAKRNLLDALRMLEAEKRGGDRQRETLDVAASTIRLLDVLSAGATRPGTRVGRDEAVGLLGAAIEALPADYRLVVEAYDLHGRDMSEIAAELGRTRGSAYMLRARAHRLLRSRLGDSTRFFSTSA